MVTGAAIAPFTSCNMEKKKEAVALKNWAGNFTFSTSNLLEPTTVEEVQRMVMENKKLRTLGTRHCFNRIADSDSALLSTSKLTDIGTIDQATSTITVGAGIRYGDLCIMLHEKGFAIHNLASLPHISVAGACATATHGSGVNNGNLATGISGIELVTGTGEVVSLTRKSDPDTFNGVIVNLGCLGVVTKVTLDLLPAFLMRQDVYLNLPMAQLETHFDEIMSAAYSVSLFTDWQTENVNQVWVKSVTKQETSTPANPEFFGAKLADRNVHPIIEISAENCTEQMGVAGPWYERLPHFKLGFTPSSGEELQAEFFVPRERAVEAIRAVAAAHREDLKKLLMITEIRTIAKDELWMSPCYHQDSVTIHFTLKQDIEGVNAFLPKLEATLMPFNPKPHWGKLFTFTKDVLKSRYEKMDDFKGLVAKYDPAGKFRNDFINNVL